LDKKDKKEKFVDDGRVIADMSVDGMPPPLLGRKAYKKRRQETAGTEAKLSPREYVSVFFGMISSYALVGLVVFGGLALFILFCIKVWFK